MAKPNLHSVPNQTVVCEIDLELNDVALMIFGPSEKHLKFIKKHLPVTLKTCGNKLTIEGNEHTVHITEKTIQYLKEQALTGSIINTSEVLDALRLYQDKNNTNTRQDLKNHVISFTKKKIFPRTTGQLEYLNVIKNHDITFGIGPAGTGKTYLAMAIGMSKLLRGEVNRLILTRPAVEAGEKLGFLPGDLAEKVNPYLRPLYDALHDMVDYERASRMIVSGIIEIAPIAFMRGRTLNDNYVILDEAQNCTPEQMKMFLTRLGENCQAVVTGDITQVDLPKGQNSGLIHAVKLLNKIDGIAIHKFTEKDVVRHPLVAEIIKAYEQENK